jgi:uncharacterized protein YbjT (DUF2867 family)
MLDPIEHRNPAWTPTGSEALSYGEVAGIMTAVLGRPIRYAQPGLLSYAFHASQGLHMPAGMVAVTSAVYSTARLGLAAGLPTTSSTSSPAHHHHGAAFIHRERAAFRPGAMS